MTQIDPTSDRPRRVTIKIGSAVVSTSGSLNASAVDRLAGEIADIIQSGVFVVLVSSGAVACGLGTMGLTSMPSRLSDRQAAAAIGQPLLIRAWSEAFARRGLVCAQVLLTEDDIEHRSRFINAKQTIDTLLRTGVVPIVNENDSVAYDELRLGDNDRLSALTAGLVNADTLAILSTAPGVCRGGPDGPVERELTDIEAARTWVTRERSSTGIGGMETKLDAAAIARAMGIETVIAAGREAGVVRIALGMTPGMRIGTRIPAAASSSPARKQWIGSKRRSRGIMEVDRGARDAIILRGASLLPKGVVRVASVDSKGFDAGDTVDVRFEGEIVARGLTSYRYDDAVKIAGMASEAIADVLGYCVCDEIIHRDNLALVTTPQTNAHGSEPSE